MKTLNSVVLLALLVACSTSCKPATPTPRRDGGVTPGDSATPGDSVRLPDAPPATDAPVAPDGSGHVNGSFAVDVNTGGAQSNCGRTGADLVEIRVSLVDSAGSCTPTSFRLLSSVGGQVTEVRSACPSTPASFSCFERDARLSAQGLVVGGYHLLVDGVVAGRVCWKGDASLGVTETPDEQSLTLLRQAGC